MYLCKKIMKYIINIFYIILFYLLIISCGSKTTKTGNEDYNFSNPLTAENINSEENIGDGLPTMDFKETEYNFGVVINGEKVVHTFILKNNGKSNLLISNVKPSCGCTSPKWTKEPIKPGQEGFVELAFDSQGRIGHQRKTATIFANTQPNTTEIAFQCDVVDN